MYSIIKLIRARGGYPNPICDRCARGLGNFERCLRERGKSLNSHIFNFQLIFLGHYHGGKLTDLFESSPAEAWNFAQRTMES